MIENYIILTKISIKFSPRTNTKTNIFNTFSPKTTTSYTKTDGTFSSWTNTN